MNSYWTAFKTRCIQIWNNITVEPLLIFAILPGPIVAYATENLILERVCKLHYNYSDTICDALEKREVGNYTIEEDAIQARMADMIDWRAILSNTLPTILLIFWGSWSDRHGKRKPCILIPIIGDIARSIGLLFCTIFEWIPAEFVAVTDSILPGLFGGNVVLMMGILSYIGDVTVEEQRIIRMGSMNICMLGVGFIALPLGGYLLQYVGAIGAYSFSIVALVISFAYGIFYIKDAVKESSNVDEPNSKAKHFLIDFFNKDHIIDTFRVLFKSNKRLNMNIVMILILGMIMAAPNSGESPLLYIFFRKRFFWDEVQSSFFSTYIVIMNIIGTSIALGIFNLLLKFNDPLIGVIATISKMCANFVYAFAVAAWELYLGGAVEVMGAPSGIAMRSIASTLVKSDELGKMNSLCAMFESLMPIIIPSIYGPFYKKTLDFLPGAFFLLSNVFYVFGVLIFFWMIVIYKRKALSNEPSDKKTDIELNGSGGHSDTDSKKTYDNPTYIPDGELEVSQL